MGWGGKGTGREERKVGEEREEGEKEGKEGSAMSPSENSLKIHWLDPNWIWIQMHQNPFSARASPRTYPAEGACNAPQPLVGWGGSPSPYPSSLEA